MKGNQVVHRSPLRLMCFDVESVGLFGDPFALAWCIGQEQFLVATERGSGQVESQERVVGHEAVIVAEGFAQCDPRDCFGFSDDRSWVQEHVIPHLPPYDRKEGLLGPTALYDLFWPIWLAEREQGTLLVADVPWPVEAHFLYQCIHRSTGDKTLAYERR